MATIIERLDTKIAALQADKTRIRTDADRDIAAVNAQLQVLRDAKATITPAVEATYAALKAAGFIQETA
jgi:hypothetical protein